MSEIEIESKFEVCFQDANKILNTLTPFSEVTLGNIYYDSNNILLDMGATFRLRTSSDRKDQQFDLKLPVASDEAGPRKMIEITEYIGPKSFHYVPKSAKPAPILSVDYFSEELSSPLLTNGISVLNCLGEMITHRHKMLDKDGLLLELDIVHLPNNKVFFEVEFESEYIEDHETFKQNLMDLCPSAKVSELSKFKRFIKTIRGNNV